MAGYIFNANKGETPASLARQRAIVEQLLAQSQGVPRNVGEGIASIGQALSGRLGARNIARKEAAGREGATAKMGEIAAALSQNFPPAPGATAQAAPMDYASQRVASAHNLAQTAPNDYASQRVAQAHGPSDMTAYQKAIASIESAGSGDYAAIGPAHPELGRPLGKYQVMEANVGPWAKEALGQDITPEQFLQNPEMQDAVFNSQFGKYVQQYGDPEKAAQAWFGGPGGVGKTNRQDSLGTSVGEYGQKFSQALGQPQQPAQMAGGIDPVLEALGARAIPKDGPSMEMLIGAAGDQWMNDSQKGIVDALLSKKLNPEKPKQTDDMLEFLYGQQNPEFNNYMLNQKKAGATNVTVGGGKYGTIPAGFELIEGPNGAQLRPIPGGPEDTSKTDQAAADNQAVVSDVIMGAATKAREIAKNAGRMATGLGGQLLSNIGESDAAELRRQVEVMKSNAKISNLQAMRAASPTGGALGAVSDRENDMLAAKSGAIDPNAHPDDFAKALDDYELTLLRIVHGKDAGDRIFQASRKGGDLPEGVTDDDIEHTMKIHGLTREQVLERLSAP